MKMRYTVSHLQNHIFESLNERNSYNIYQTIL